MKGYGRIQCGNSREPTQPSLQSQGGLGRFLRVRNDCPVGQPVRSTLESDTHLEKSADRGSTRVIWRRPEVGGKGQGHPDLPALPAHRPTVGGWSSYQMVSRYARGNAGERAVKAHKALSPGDRLNIR